jgi:hypothetical protein
MFYFEFLLVILITSIIKSVSTGICDVQLNVRVRLYEHAYCEGIYEEMTASRNNWNCDYCYNIGSELNDKVSSWKAMTANSYLWLYEHVGCKGESIRLSANEGSCDTISFGNFNDKASSYKITYRPG